MPVLQKRWVNPWWSVTCLTIPHHSINSQSPHSPMQYSQANWLWELKSVIRTHNFHILISLPERNIAKWRRKTSRRNLPLRKIKPILCWGSITEGSVCRLFYGKKSAWSWRRVLGCQVLSCFCRHPSSGRPVFSKWWLVVHYVRFIGFSPSLLSHPEAYIHYFVLLKLVHA